MPDININQEYNLDVSANSLSDEQGYKTRAKTTAGKKFAVGIFGLDLSDINNYYNSQTGENSKLSAEERQDIDNIFNTYKTSVVDREIDRAVEQLGGAEALPNLKESQYLPNKVAGNLLDQYYTPMYSLRFFMMKKAAYRSNIQEVGSETTTTNNGNTDAKQPKIQITKPRPEDIVILAETGVTDIIIDDLTISHYGANDDFTGASINFKLTEPGSISFLDRYAACKKFCNFKGSLVPLFLEIRFKGWTDDTTDIDSETAGKSVPIIGPYIYELGGVKFDMNLDSDGAVYNFTAFTRDEVPKRTSVYTTSRDTNISGKDMRELLKSLETNWNQMAFEDADEKGYKVDKFVIPLDQILLPEANKDEAKASQQTNDEEAQKIAPNSDLIKGTIFKDVDKVKNFYTFKGKLTENNAPSGTPAASGSDDPAVSQQQNNDVKKPPEFSDRGKAFFLKKRKNDVETSDNDASSEITGTQANKTSQITLSYYEGTKIYDIIADIFSLSEELFKKVSRHVDPNDPESDVKKAKAYTTWWRLSTEMKYNFDEPFDKKRNQYVVTHYFTPIFTEEADTNMGVSQKEVEANLNLTEEEIRRRLEEIKISKEYLYFFTGQNDQVLDLNMSFSEAYAINVPFYARGDHRQSFATKDAAQLRPDEKSKLDQDAKELEELEKKNQQSSLFDTIKALTGAINNIEDFKDNPLGQAAEFAGYTDAEIKAIVGGNDELSQQLAVTLSGDQFQTNLTDSILQSTRNQQGVSTESDDADNNNQTSQNKITNYRFASELVPGLESEDISSVWSEADTDNTADKSLDETKPSIVAKEVDHDKESNIVERGSLRSSIFAHLMDEHAGASSNKKIQMEIRGDPWYLGKGNFYVESQLDERTDPRDSDSERKAEKEKTDLAGAVWSGGKNQCLIIIESPRKFDFDIDNEDQNTGLWDFGGTNYTMSGVYNITTADSSFSGGEYTVSLGLYHQNGFHMTKLEKVKQLVSKKIDSYLKDKSAQEEEKKKTDKSSDNGAG